MPDVEFASLRFKVLQYDGTNGTAVASFVGATLISDDGSVIELDTGENPIFVHKDNYVVVSVKIPRLIHNLSAHDISGQQLDNWYIRVPEIES